MTGMPGRKMTFSQGKYENHQIPDDFGHNLPVIPQFNFKKTAPIVTGWNGCRPSIEKRLSIEQ